MNPKTKSKQKVNAHGHAHPPGSFMARLLERKEAERKRLEKTKQHPFSHNEPKSTFANNGVHGFSRFNGPRRRAA